MKGKAHADDFQVQDFVKKKKKKKRKQNESNDTHEDAEIVEDPELSQCSSPVLFEDAAQGREDRKKKKKLKKRDEKQQALMDNYIVRVEPEISNGTEAAASPRKKSKRKGQESTDELSDVTCVLVNQYNNQDCQEDAADYVYFKKPKKKKKEKQPEVDEVCELPPSEEHSKAHKEKSKKKRKKRREGSAQEVEEDTEEAAEQGKGHREWPSPAAEDGDCDAASAITEGSMELPADFSTPTKAADRAKKTPARAKKTPARAKKAIKSRAFVMDDSSSESDGTTPKDLASHKKKQQNNSFAELAASDEVSVDGDEDLDPAMTSAMDLDTARQELEEFIPHVKNISDSSIKKMAGRDLKRFKAFKEQGIAVKFGRFTQKENKQIQKNVEEFLSTTGIASAEKLLFTSRYPNEKGTIHRLKTKHHFCEKISEGIPRPWRLIYYRARKMFDPNNYKGRYSKEEKETLKKYQALHGNDWKKISELMSRSNLSVAMKFSEIKSAINYGPWTKEETQKLMNAVKEVLRRKLQAENPNSPLSLEESDTDLWVEREKLHQALPWTEIETKVGSRYWRQCKQKWSSILASRLTRGQELYRGTSGLRAKIHMIKRLYETKAEDASEVNWDELTNAFGDVPRTYVQSKFYRLKVSSVPLWKRKTFSEIVDYLYEKKLPELEEKLKKEEGKVHSFGISAASQQQQIFRFSDIFDSGEESD